MKKRDNNAKSNGRHCNYCRFQKMCNKETKPDKEILKDFVEKLLGENRTHFFQVDTSQTIHNQVKTLMAVK